MIRLSQPLIDDSDIEAVNRVLRTGYLVQGTEVSAFEDSVRSVVGTRHAIAVSNCTAALHLSLVAAGIGPGDVVAVSAYSWLSTANVIELVGAKPLFIDIEFSTFNMDATALRLALEGAATKPVAVLVVDAFGGMAPLTEISAVCDEFGIPMIEDAACAIGAARDGRSAGAWGAAGCFSFHPRKAVTTGEGGVITTDDDELAERLRSLRNHGLDPNAPSPDFIMAGYNLRMTEFQAALGVTQMTKLASLIDGRRSQAAFYNLLLESSEIATPGPVGESHVFQSYVVSVPGLASGGVQQVITGLNDAGIQATIGTYHMPLTTFFRNTYGYSEGDFPGADRAITSAVSLPLHHGLSQSDQELVISTLEAVVDRIRN
ncbi:MAG: DegT/DnrJ/EryC1/StrS family aminotransferase [Microthrixaceae bacterium]